MGVCAGACICVRVHARVYKLQTVRRFASTPSVQIDRLLIETRFPHALFRSHNQLAIKAVREAKEQLSESSGETGDGLLNIASEYDEKVPEP